MDINNRNCPSVGDMQGFRDSGIHVTQFSLANHLELERPGCLIMARGKGSCSLAHGLPTCRPGPYSAGLPTKNDFCLTGSVNQATSFDSRLSGTTDGQIEDRLTTTPKPYESELIGFHRMPVMFSRCLSNQCSRISTKEFSGGCTKQADFNVNATFKPQLKFEKNRGNYK